MADNPFVFPGKTRKNTSTDPLATPREIEHHGMTLRDWFAGQAIGALIARMSKESFENSIQCDDWSFEAGDAYAIADAMLAERSK